MAVTDVGSTINVQHAATSLRQAVQQEQVATTLVKQAATDTATEVAAEQATAQTTSQADTQDNTQEANSAAQESRHENSDSHGRGERVDVRA